MTWIVMCPKWKSKAHRNKAHGWSLSGEELDNIGKQYFDLAVKCIACGHKFSLQQGVKEAFSSDIPFAIHDFQYNARESGNTEITVGQLETISFSKPFDDPPKIYLTPYEKPVAVVSGRITTAQFSIFSCNSGTEGEKRKVGWAAYGNRAYAAIPIWRKLLARSKEHQLRKDFRPELVDLESAFEVFIGEYLGKRLENKFRKETIDWMLKLRMQEQLKGAFTELTGQPLSKLESGAYARWQNNVKKLRNSVVHRGASVTQDQAHEAREATFDLMTRIDPTTIDYFQIQLEKIRPKHPNMTFGTATIKGKE